MYLTNTMLCTKLYFHFTFFLTYFRAIFIEKQLVGKMNILAFEKGIIIVQKQSDPK